jgi:prepilin signal peptidase PulO-like enzyme (type II secretory pathway)
MENFFENLMKKKYPVLPVIFFFAAGIGIILTFQWIFGLVLAIIALIFAIAFHYLDSHGPETGDQAEWVMIVSGVIGAAMATAIAPWLVWAVLFAVMFLFLHILVRIERRPGMLEFQNTRRVLRRRTRGRTVERHRA